MNEIKKIIGISFLSLIISSICIAAFLGTDNLYFLMIPVFTICIINLGLGLFLYLRGRKNLAHTYMLSSILILIIGGSSCVSIKIRPKPTPPIPSEKPILKTDSAAT
jgi:hypothetical protein